MLWSKSRLEWSRTLGEIEVEALMQVQREQTWCSHRKQIDKALVVHRINLA